MLPLNQGLCSDSEQKSKKALHYGRNVKKLSENKKVFFVFFWLEIFKNAIWILLFLVSKAKNSECQKILLFLGQYLDISDIVERRGNTDYVLSQLAFTTQT